MTAPTPTAATTSGGCYVVRFNKVINADTFISRAVPPDPFSALAVNVEEAARFRDRLNYERDRYLEAEARVKKAEFNAKQPPNKKILDLELLVRNLRLQLNRAFHDRKNERREKKKAQDMVTALQGELDAVREDDFRLVTESPGNEDRGANGSGGGGEELYRVEETSGVWYVQLTPFTWRLAGSESAAYAFSKKLKELEAARLAAVKRAKEGERLGRVWQARHRLAVSGSEKNRFRAEDAEAKLADVTAELRDLKANAQDIDADRAADHAQVVQQRDEALQQLAEARKALQAAANKLITITAERNAAVEDHAHVVQQRDEDLRQLAKARDAFRATADKLIATTAERNAAREDRDAARREVDEVVVPVSAPPKPAHKQVEPPLAFLDTVATAIYSQGGFTASQAYDGAHNLLNERYRRHQEAQEAQETQ